MSGPTDWITPAAAVAEFGIPIESIAMYMRAGLCGEGGE
jgi:hypothetical protein